MTTITLDSVILEAREAAQTATMDYIDAYLGGEDKFPCGFAWVNIYEYEGKKIRKNSKMGKALESMGARKSDYEGGYKIWNPSGTMFQNLDCKEAGAQASAKVLQKYGFTAYAGGRMD